jgi:hypothetical protein
MTYSGVARRHRWLTPAQFRNAKVTGYCNLMRLLDDEFGESIDVAPQHAPQSELDATLDEKPTY